MRFGKKFTMGFVPTLLVLVAMLVTACGGGGGAAVTPTAGLPAKAPASQQILREPLPVTDIATFDPGQSTDLYSAQAIEAVFTGLVQLNDQLQVVGQLAKSWTHSADSLTWTFTLKSGLTFSDGTALTSQDVIYSIDRALSPQVSSLNGVSLTYLGLVKDSDKRVAGKIPSLINDSLMAPDPSTVVIKLNNPGAYFLQALTYQTSYVVEKKVIDQWGLKFTDHLADNGGQGGAGPFVVQSYDHTKGITLVPNTKYYGAKPQLSQLQYLFYNVPTTTYNAYQAGQLDETYTTGTVPSADYATASQSKEFVKQPTLDIAYVAMNYLAKPFDNIKIRQAFAMALDKDLINTAIYKGQFVPTCHIVPNGMPGYFAGLKCPGGVTTAGNMAMAKTLFQQGMQEEGYTASTFPAVTLTYPSGSQDRDNAVTTERQMWTQAFGIDVKAAAINFNQLITDLNGTVGNGKLQMWQIGWIADYPDPQDWTTLQFDKGSPNNYFNYGQNNSTDAAQQQATQKLLEQADVTADPTARLQLYNQAEQQLVNDVAWLPIYQGADSVLIKSYVIGRKLNGFGLTPPDDWGSVYIAVH